MKAWLELTAGFACLLLGLGYLYRPDLISRMNAFLRECLLNDAHIALERRKWGTFFFLLAFLLIYMSYSHTRFHLGEQALPAVRRAR